MVSSSTFSLQFMTKVMLSHLPFYFGSLYSIQYGPREQSGSVVERLTRDRWATGSSLTGRHCVVSLSKDTFILA